MTVIRQTRIWEYTFECPLCHATAQHRESELALSMTRTWSMLGVIDDAMDAQHRKASPRCAGRMILVAAKVGSMVDRDERTSNGFTEDGA
jgi:hypothetical protein